MIRSLSRAALLALVTSCKLVGTYPEVDEVREFPEYGGWLPVTEEGRPALEYFESSKWEHAPETREAAEQAVAKKGSGRRYRAWTTTDWLGLAYSPLIAYGAPVDIGLGRPTEHHDPHLHTIAVEISVVDERHAPLAGAVVAGLNDFAALPSFLAEDGTRRLAPVAALPWSTSTEFARAVAEHAPAEIVGPASVTFCGMPFAFVPDRRASPALVRTNEYGLCTLTVDVPALPVRAGAPGAYVVAWMPGFEPATATLEGVERQSSMLLEIRLRSATSSDQQLAREQRLRAASDAILHCIRPSFLHLDDRVDHDLLRDANQSLRALMQDTDAPGWIRRNAYVALERQLEIERRLCAIAGSLLTFPRDEFAAERLGPLDDELAGLRATAAPGCAYRLDSAQNPWLLRYEFRRWLGEACVLGLDRAEGGDPRRKEEQDELVSRARELLARCEGLDPTQPSVETLRAAIALSEGDLPSAIAQSRFLGTREYFGLFYGSLRRGGRLRRS